MTGWRVLDLTNHDGPISVGHGHLTVDDHHVAASDLAVVLVGTSTSLPAGALALMARHDVAVLVCDWRGAPLTGMYPWKPHSRVGARQLAQAELSRPRRKNAWKQVVTARVRGQAATLHHVNPRKAQALRVLAGQVRSGDPSNIEAHAARTYWRYLFEPGWTRQAQADDGINSCLNYGYGIIRGLGMNAVCSAGLAPALGIHHRTRTNPFNLVEDLIEPYRPIADYIVCSARVTHLTAETKATIVSHILGPTSADGTGIGHGLTRLAQAYGRYCEGNEDRLVVPTWSGHLPTPDHAQG